MAVDQNMTLKGHTNETYFLIFLYILVRHRSLTLLIKFFEIRIRIEGDIRNRKLTLHIVDTESRRLRVSLIPRVDFWFFSNEFGREEVVNSPYRWYGESATLCVTDTGSHRWWFAVHSVNFKWLPMPLKRVCHEIFDNFFLSWIRSFLSPDCRGKKISNFFENSSKYSRISVSHRCQRHRVSRKKYESYEFFI